MQSVREVGDEPGQLPLDVCHEAPEQAAGELQGVVLGVVLVTLLRPQQPPSLVLRLLLALLRLLRLLHPLLRLLPRHQAGLWRLNRRFILLSHIKIYFKIS